MAGMAGEIDEDINRILADELGEAVVGKARDVSPFFYGLPEAPGDGVGLHEVGVGEYLEIRSVVKGELIFEKIGDRVIGKIG